MKSLLIKNRTAAPLVFAFCTISQCSCDVCEEWLVCENKPIADSPGATFGILIVDGFAERVDRFCPQWDCVGACFFDEAPSIVTSDMLFDYDEGKSYTIGDGEAELSFTHAGQANGSAMAQPRTIKYLHVQNNSPVTLYFAFCTISQCTCDVCMEWLAFETTPIDDRPGWTVGKLLVKPFESKVERFCSHWDCTGSIFVQEWPDRVEMDDLFDFDEDSDYSIADGLLTLSFTHQLPRPASQRENISKYQGSFSNGSGGTAVVGTVLGGAATAYRGYQGAQFVEDVFNGVDDGDIADAVGSILEGLAGGCVIS